MERQENERCSKLGLKVELHALTKNVSSDNGEQTVQYYIFEQLQEQTCHEQET